VWKSNLNNNREKAAAGVVLRMSAPERERKKEESSIGARDIYKSRVAAAGLLSQI
jgi:hypothetical protein